MNTRRHLPLFLISIFCLATVGVAQDAAKPQQVEPSFDVTLHLLIGSNDASSRTELPASLNAVSRHLKMAMPFANYRLANTFLGRVANGGHLEYKSMSNIFGEETEQRFQAFQEWSVTSLKSLPNDKGGQGFQAQAFRFGARVPVTTGTYKDETGKIANAVNFESIGLALVRLGLADNTPTLIGTLSLPGANGTIFLVMTVKPVE